MIAAELGLPSPLNWHVTSKSTLDDALYRYDALGRLYATQSGKGGSASAVERFVALGPLGTALAAEDRPRAVLIDEIDKSDLDLPGDLLHVLELGEFEIPPLIRDAQDIGHTSGEPTLHQVRGADGGTYTVRNGVVRRTHLPIIVLTSNGEQAFSPPFLRRCVRFEMPTPKQSFIEDVITKQLGDVVGAERATIHKFAERLVKGENLAIDQLLGLVYLVTGEAAPGTEARKRVEQILLAELSGR